MGEAEEVAMRPPRVSFGLGGLGCAGRRPSVCAMALALTLRTSMHCGQAQGWLRLLREDTDREPPAKAAPPLPLTAGAPTPTSPLAEAPPPGELAPQALGNGPDTNG